MTTTRLENDLTTLRALKPELANRYKVQAIGIFGSSARGEERPGSDLDVLVTFAAGADLFDLVGLGLFLEQQFERRVDVVPHKALREELRAIILSEVVLA